MVKSFIPSWELFNKSIALVRDHYLGVMYLVLLPSLVNALGSLLLGVLNLEDGMPALTQTQLVGVVLMVVSFAWQLVNVGPLAYFALQAASGKKSATLITYYREGLRYTPKLVLYYIIFGLLLLGGFLLFVVPALFVLRRYVLGPYYLVDAKLGTIQALKAAGKRSKAASGGIWGVIGVSFTIILAASFLQAIFSSVGLLLGELLLCTTTFLIALRYRTIEPSTPKL